MTQGDLVMSMDDTKLGGAVDSVDRLPQGVQVYPKAAGEVGDFVSLGQSHMKELGLLPYAWDL